MDQLTNQSENDVIRYNRVLTMLHEFNIRMTEMIPSSQNFNWIVDIVYKIFPQAHSVSMQFWDEKSNLVTEWVNDPYIIETPMNFGKKQGIAGYAVMERQVMNVPDIENDDRYIFGPYKPKYRALLVAPLIVSDAVLGTLSITAETVGAFDTQDENFIDMLARQIAVLLHRAELYRKEREQRLFAEALRDIIVQAYQSSLSTMKWDNIFGYIRSTVPYTAANIILTELFEYEEFVYTEGYQERGVDLNELLKKVSFKTFRTSQQMLKTKKPYRIPDTLENEDWEYQADRTHWIRSYLGAPLTVQDQVIGFLSLDSDQPGFFTQLHEDRIMVFATAISHTLEQYQLLQNERKEKQMVNALRDSLAALANPFELQDILTHLLLVLQNIVNHTASNIVFLTQDGVYSYIVRSMGYENLDIINPLALEPIPVASLATYRHMLKTKEVLIISDTEGNKFWNTDLYPEDEWVQSYAGAPIIISGEVIGFFNIDSSQKNWFTQRHIGILESFANQASLAIQRARLFEAEREQRLFANKLSEIITGLNNTANLDELFHHILQSISDVIVNDGATISLFKDQDHIYFGALTGTVLETNPHLKDMIFYWRDFSTWRTMYETQEPLLIRDTIQSDLWGPQFNVKWIHSYVGTPIVDGNQQVIGFINVDGSESNQFNEQDARRLKIFADHLATVIQRTKLLEAERNQREIADTLREIGLIVASSLKPTEFLSAIIHHLKRVIKYTSSCVWLVNSPGVWEQQLGYYDNGQQIEGQLNYASKTDLMDFLRQAETTQDIVLISIPADEHSAPDVAESIHSVAVAPIIVRENVVGALVLAHILPEFYGEHHRSILHGLASQLAIAIDNANLYKQQQAAHDEIRFYADSLEEIVQERTNALDAERLKLSTILHEIGEGVIVIERDSEKGPYVSFVNNMLCQMLGTSIEDMKNSSLRSVAETFVPNMPYPSLLYKFDTTDLTPSTSVDIDLVIKPLEKSSFEAQVSFTLVNLEETKWLGILLVRDVTHERMLQKQRERFLANASHELRTPLTNLNTRFYLMRHQPEKLDAHLAVVERTTQKMTALVNDLLDLMRVNQKISTETLMRCNLRDVLHDIHNVQLAEAELKHIRFSLVMPDEPIYMLAQTKHLDQIFTNLISNAILYTPEGGEIDLICEIKEPDVVVSVRDTGIGIPPEFTQAIFEPFTRVNVDELGTGLGLSIVKELVESYGGAISVDSKLGKGSTFMIQLPTLSYLKQ